MWDHIIYIAIIAFFALGFRATLRSLVEGTWMAGRKPFSCDTCLVWWGSVIGTAFIYIVALDLEEITLVESTITWIVYVLSAMGVAKHLLRSSAGLKLDSVYDRVLEQMGPVREPCDGCGPGPDDPLIVYGLGDEVDENEEDQDGQAEQPDGHPER